jgi:hypothetical protein
MKRILDAGAFVAVEKRDRRVGALLRVLQQRRTPVCTSAAVVAQIWRDGRKQVAIARLLAGVDTRPLAPDDDKRTGELLAAARTSDVVDGHVALLAEDEDLVMTSDKKDLERLLDARGVAVTLIET